MRLHMRVPTRVDKGVPYGFVGFDPSERDVVEDLRGLKARLEALGLDVRVPDEDPHTVDEQGRIVHARAALQGA